MSELSEKTLIVRIWLEPSEKRGGEWRASVTDTETREKRYFASRRALLKHLTAADNRLLDMEE
jgi:hypothetical protein